MRVLFLVLISFISSAYAKPKVLASFSILGDMVREVGKDKVEVQSLVGPNQDSHVFEPRPQDLKAFENADIVIINGFGFEGWLTRLVAASRCRGKIVVATIGVTPLMRLCHGREVSDPHAWHSLKNAAIYIDNIVQALTDLLPHEASFFRERGEDYKKRCRELEDRTIHALLNIPQKRRKVLTNHEAFGYLGRDFGITFYSPVGMSTEAEPSAKAVTKLIKRIREDDIQAVFIENISNPRLIEQIAEETGAKIGGVLYSDALDSPGTEVDSYLKMMTFNLHSLLKAVQKPQ